MEGRSDARAGDHALQQVPLLKRGGEPPDFQYMLVTSSNFRGIAWGSGSRENPVSPYVLQG
jgi:hypothetical protein